MHGVKAEFFDAAVIKSQHAWLTFNRYSNMVCLSLLETSNINFRC